MIFFGSATSSISLKMSAKSRQMSMNFRISSVWYVLICFINSKHSSWHWLHQWPQTNHGAWQELLEDQRCTMVSWPPWSFLRSLPQQELVESVPVWVLAAIKAYLRGAEMVGLDRRGCFEHHKSNRNRLLSVLAAISLSRSLFISAFVADNNLLTFWSLYHWSLT